MSEVLRRHFLFRRSAYWTMALYIAIDLLTSTHTWLLEIKGKAETLTNLDYATFFVSAVLSALLMIKALQNDKWHKTAPPTTTNERPN